MSLLVVRSENAQTSFGRLELFLIKGSFRSSCADWSECREYVSVEWSAINGTSESVTSLTLKTQGTSWEKGQKGCKSQCLGKTAVKQHHAYHRTTALMLPQQPVPDQASQHSAWLSEGRRGPTLSWEAAGSWLLLGEPVLSMNMAVGRFPVLQWMAPTHAHADSTNWTWL